MAKEPYFVRYFDNTDPVQCMYALAMAFDGGIEPRTATAEQHKAFMVLAERIVDRIPITPPKKEPDWKYIAGHLRQCGYLVGCELDRALEELVVR